MKIFQTNFQHSKYVANSIGLMLIIGISHILSDWSLEKVFLSFWKHYFTCIYKIITAAFAEKIHWDMMLMISLTISQRFSGIDVFDYSALALEFGEHYKVEIDLHHLLCGGRDLHGKLWTSSLIPGLSSVKLWVLSPDYPHTCYIHVLSSANGWVSKSHEYRTRT